MHPNELATKKMVEQEVAWREQRNAIFRTASQWHAIGKTAQAVIYSRAAYREAEMRFLSGIGANIPWLKPKA